MLHEAYSASRKTRVYITVEIHPIDRHETEDYAADIVNACNNITNHVAKIIGQAIDLSDKDNPRSLTYLENIEKYLESLVKD